MKKKIQNFFASRAIGGKSQKILSKHAGDSQIVVALVLIAVAVGLCIIFKAQIYNIMSNLFNIIGSTIDNLSKGI